MFKKGLTEQTPLRGFFGEIPQNSCNAALVVELNKITKTKTAGLVPQLPFIYWKGVVVGARVQRTADHFLKTLLLRTFPPRSLGETPARFECKPRLASIQKVCPTLLSGSQ